MKLTGLFTYQGCEARTGIKDTTKVYYEVAFISGIEQLRCSCDKEFFLNVLPNIKPLTQCNCEFSLNTTYNSLRLVGISPVK